MTEDNSEVDLQAILARLNANSTDDPDENDGEPGLSDALKDHLTDPEDTNQDSKSNDGREEEQKVLSTELTTEVDSLSNENKQTAQQDNLQNIVESSEVKTEDVKDEKIESLQKQDIKDSNSIPQSDPALTTESQDAVKEEEPVRKNSTSARKESTNSADDTDNLLERIQKIKNQIFTVREDAEDEHSQEMLTEQSKGIQLVSYFH